MSVSASNERPCASRRSFMYRTGVVFRWLANSRSLSATITTKLERGKSFERPMPLYTHPSPPEGMVMVPLKATNSITCAIENEVDSQLVASAMDPRLMHRQDGSDVWDAAIAAVIAPPTSSADSRKGE